MRLNKHALLWSSLGALIVLGYAAYSENVLADWRQCQRKVAEAVPGFEVQLRQVVVPSLRAFDRCVSCHVGMAPGEKGIEGDPVYGKHPPVVHDPAEFGCTVCHGGQGRATTIADAHGDVPHWPEPMIPKRYLWAGCGTCHTHLKVPNQSRYDRGRRLFERFDCLACHRVEGRGGTLRPGGAGGGEGPDLSRVGTSGLPADWYERHLERRRLAAEGKPADTLPWVAAFGEIPADDRAALQEYLHSLIGAPRLLEAKSLFHSLGCRGCHKVHGVGGDDGPDLSAVGQRDPARTDFSRLRGPRNLATWLAEHFRDPARVVPGSKMPALDLTDEEIDLLVLYMFSLRKANVPEALWPRDRMQALRLGEREFSTDGSTLYGTFCAACHGARGEGMRFEGLAPFPAIANPDFLAVASDEFLTRTIQHGRPGRRMPAWGEKTGGLGDDEIASIVAYLRASAGGIQVEPDTKPRRWAKGEGGERLYAEHCASCHGAKGEGVEGLALNNSALLASATDTYLFETIRRGRRGTTMPGFGTGSPSRRALSPQEIESIVAFLRTWE